MVPSVVPLIYKGLISPDTLLTPSAGDDAALSDATIASGVGNWHLYNGRRSEAEALFRRTIAGVGDRRSALSPPRRS